MLKRIQDVDAVAALRDNDKFPLGREGNGSPITATASQIMNYVRAQLGKVFQPLGDYTSMKEVRKVVAQLYQPIGDYTSLKEVKATMARLYQPIGDYVTLKQVKLDSQVAKAIQATDVALQASENIGSMSQLRTNDASSLVAAINEVYLKVGYSSLVDTLQSFKDSDNINESIMAHIADLRAYVDEANQNYQVIKDYDDGAK